MDDLQQQAAFVAGADRKRGRLAVTTTGIAHQHIGLCLPDAGLRPGDGHDLARCR